MDSLHFISPGHLISPGTATSTGWPTPLRERRLLRPAVPESGPKSPAGPAFWGIDVTEVSRLKLDAFPVTACPSSYRELEKGLHV